jgi:hypothetical protein
MKPLIIKFLAEFCPALTDPEGGASQCTGWGPGGHFKACEISCSSGLKFSQSVPKFYACGAEGFWHPSQDIERPLTYPSCTGKHFLVNHYTTETLLSNQFMIYILI